MGVEPQIVGELTRGIVSSAVDLDRAHHWLDQRVDLTPEEIADYHAMSAAAWRSVPVVPAQKSSWQRPKMSLPVPRKTGVVALRTLGVVALAVGASLVAVTLTRSPGDSAASSTAASTPRSTGAAPGTAPPTDTPPSPSTSPPTAAATSPSNTSSSTPFSAPSNPTPGELIGEYDKFELSASFGFDFASGGHPTPGIDYASDSDGSYYDFWNEDNGDFASDSGELSLSFGSPTFAACQNATAYASSLDDIKPGDTVCYESDKDEGGNSVVAAVTVVNSLKNVNGVDYVVLDVKIWQGPQSQS
jgi:hypothetical protein